MSWVDVALNRISMTAMSSLLAIPLIYSLGPAFESTMFPVVTDVQITVMRSASAELEIEVEFDKLRPCKFEQLIWHDPLGQRIDVDFEPDADEYPRDRPTWKQRAGPWIFHRGTLEGSMAIVRHSCHPLWYTESRFYP